MSEYRWSKFWWADYESDACLRLCSLAAQGLWMRMLCAMHRGQPYGHLAIHGEAPSARQLVLMVSATEKEVARLVPELEKAGVLSRTPEGIIFCRRMVRDKQITDKAREDGKHGGNPALKQPQGLTPPVKDAGLTPTLKPDIERRVRKEKERKEDINPNVQVTACPERAEPAAWPPPPTPSAVEAAVGQLTAKLEGRYGKRQTPQPRPIAVQLAAVAPTPDIKPNLAPPAVLAEARARLMNGGKP